MNLVQYKENDQERKDSYIMPCPHWKENWTKKRPKKWEKVNRRLHVQGRGEENYKGWSRWCNTMHASLEGSHPTVGFTIMDVKMKRLYVVSYDETNYSIFKALYLNSKLQWKPKKYRKKTLCLGLWKKKKLEKDIVHIWEKITSKHQQENKQNKEMPHYHILRFDR